MLGFGSISSLAISAIRAAFVSTPDTHDGVDGAIPHHVYKFYERQRKKKIKEAKKLIKKIDALPQAIKEEITEQTTKAIIDQASFDYSSLAAAQADYERFIALLVAIETKIQMYEDDSELLLAIAAII